MPRSEPPTPLPRLWDPWRKTEPLSLAPPMKLNPACPQLTGCWQWRQALRTGGYFPYPPAWGDPAPLPQTHPSGEGHGRHSALQAPFPPLHWKPETRSPDIPWSVWRSQAVCFSESRAAAGEDSAFLRPEDATEPECESWRPQSTTPAQLDDHAAQATSARGDGSRRDSPGLQPGRGAWGLQACTGGAVAAAAQRRHSDERHGPRRPAGRHVQRHAPPPFAVSSS